MNEKLCRLCMNTISDSDFEPIEYVKNFLTDLLLNLNLDISSRAVVCYTCINNIEIFSNFKKLICVNIEDTKFAIPDIKRNESDSEQADDTNNINSIGNQKNCHFCGKSLGIWDFTALNETKENLFLVVTLQKHIPEWNLKDTDELLTCHTCLDSLQNLLNFIKNWVELEEKIQRYVKLKGINGKGQIELNDVQKFTFKPVPKCETGCSNIADMEERDEKREQHMIVKIEAIIKVEDEINNTDLTIKPEELDIILKEDGCESVPESAAIKTNNQPMDISLLQSQRRHFKEGANQSKGTVLNSADKKIYKCEQCPFESKYKESRRRHQWTHKSPSELIMFKCDICTYKAKLKAQLKKHKLIHDSPAIVTMYKCELCPFETKYKDSLKRHKLIHESPSDVKKFKCDMCSYEVKHKNNLIKHMLIHKNSDVIMYKCELCPYEAKRKDNLQQHTLTHKSISELMMFKCELCPFETKYQTSLKGHNLTHVDTSEIRMFKCDLCPHETRRRSNLKAHKLNHKNFADVTVFKCELCPYETKFKGKLQRHSLIHKSTSEIKMFKCELCPYETKYHSSLKRHNLRTHKHV